MTTKPISMGGRRRRSRAIAAAPSSRQPVESRAPGRPGLRTGAGPIGVVETHPLAGPPPGYTRPNTGVRLIFRRAPAASGPPAPSRLQRVQPRHQLVQRPPQRRGDASGRSQRGALFAGEDARQVAQVDARGPMQVAEGQARIVEQRRRRIVTPCHTVKISDRCTTSKLPRGRRRP